MRNPKLLLAATAAILLSGTALAQANEAHGQKPQAVRCRVGNGKSSSYLDGVHACAEARAQGAKVIYEKSENQTVARVNPRVGR